MKVVNSHQELTAGQKRGGAILHGVSTQSLRNSIPPAETFNRREGPTSPARGVATARTDSTTTFGVGWADEATLLYRQVGNQFPPLDDDPNPLYAVCETDLTCEIPQPTIHRAGESGIQTGHIAPLYGCSLIPQGSPTERFNVA